MVRGGGGVQDGEHVYTCVMAEGHGLWFLLNLHTLRPHGLQPTRLLCPWDLPGKNIGVGCQSLLQRIFPTQGSNPALAAQAQEGPEELSHIEGQEGRR